MSFSFRPVLSWMTFAAGMFAGIAGFAATFPMWIQDIGSRGHAETGCRFEERAEGWMVTELFWDGSDCEKLIGSYVRQIGDKKILTAEDLFGKVYGEAGESHTWIVEESGKQRTENVKLRAHPVVSTLFGEDGSGGGTLFALLEIFGAAAQTVNIVLSGLLFFFLRNRVSVAPALTGALFAVGLGLNFDIGFTPAWYQWVGTLALLVGILGLGTAVVALPDGTIRSPRAAVFVALWVLLVAICNMTFLPFYDLIPEGTAAASSVIFAGGGLLALLQRQRNCSSQREKLSLRWVILGLVFPAVTLAPALAPGLPPTVQEFQLSVGFPLSTMVVPLAIVHGLHPLASFDLVRWVRFSTLGGMLVSAFAVTLATLHLVFSPILIGLGLGERLPHIAAVFALASAVSSFYFRDRLSNLVDLLFFPMRLRAQNAVPESASNLGDCWTVEEIDWCVQRALRGGFNATGAQVALPEGGGWVDLEQNPVPLQLSTEELATLKAGKAVEIVLDGDDGYATQVLPLRSRGIFLGVLIAEPSEEARYTDWDRGLLLKIADSVAEAVWRCTRVPSHHVRAGVFATREIMPKRLPTRPIN